MNKTELWDRLGRTDPAHTKTFKRAGGFSGTAIKPMWSYRRMTEEFGPCGVGWGINKPEFQVVPAGEETLVFCTVGIWYVSDDIDDKAQFKNTISEVYGVGGDKVVAKFSTGPRTDDEAFKKAFTDAVTNALKLIGVGADVHMGMFDDNKYVNTVAKEFQEAKEPPAPAVKSSASLKRAGSWEALTDNLAQDMVDVRSVIGLEKVKQEYRERAKAEGWPAAWLNALKDEFAHYEREIGGKNIVNDIADTFGGAAVTNERFTSNLMAGE